MLKNKTVLITGTSRGIGRVLVEKFAARGACILAHARKDTSAFRDDMRMISEKYGVTVTPVFFDMCDTDSMKTWFKEWVKQKIPIDILINNAGVAHGGLFQMTPVASVRKIFDVNLFAVMELTQLVLKVMTRQKSGSIINIASISGLDLKAGNCAYGTSKAALIAFTKTLAAETASLGIRTNAVAPGLTRTDMAELMEEKAGISMTRESAMGRLANPDEIANVVVFLASDQASFINGQVIRVDGGTV